MEFIKNLEAGFKTSNGGDHHRLNRQPSTQDENTTSAEMAPYKDPENDSPGSLKSLYQDKLEKRVKEVFRVGLRPKTSMTRQEFK